MTTMMSVHTANTKRATAIMAEVVTVLETPKTAMMMETSRTSTTVIMTCTWPIHPSAATARRYSGGEKNKQLYIVTRRRKKR